MSAKVHRPLGASARLVLTLTSGLLVSASGCGAIEKAKKEGTRLIFFSPAEDTVVTVDGEQTELSGGRFKSLAVGPGRHEVVVDDRTIAVELEAFDRYVVPLVEDQCFFSIDVSLSHYTANKKDALGKVEVKRRRTESAPFELPPNHYITESELPETRTGSELTLLLRSLPCEEIDRLERGVESPSPDPAPGPLAPWFAGAPPCEGAQGLTGAWCELGQAWPAAKTTELPPAGTLAGVSLTLRDGAPLQQSLADEPRPSFLAVNRGDAPSAWITTLKGDTPAEVEALEKMVTSMQGIMAGTASRPDLSADLRSYMSSMTDNAQVALVNGESEYSVGEARVRQHGSYWLTIDPFPGGLHFGVHVPIDPEAAD